MSRSGSSDSGPSARPALLSNWILFSASVVILLFLCYQGGRWGYPGERELGLTALSSWLGRQVSLPAGWFILLWVATWAACAAVLALLPRSLSERQNVAVILALAVSCRLLLLPHPHSDDVNRYLWEGRVVAHGFSPYTHPPRADDDGEVDFLRAETDPYWPHINHPEMTAIYPPLMLAGFAAIASFAYSPLAVKGVMIFFDLGTLLLILLLLRERRLSLRWAVVYAFNPVILYSFAGQGHLDAVQVFFLTFAVYLYRRKRWVSMFLCAGLAFQAKYISVIAWPFLVRRENVRHVWTAVAVAALPFLFFLPSDGMRIWDSLFRFGYEFASGGPVHGLARAALGGIAPATTLCQVLFALFWLAAWRRFRPSPEAGGLSDPVPGLVVVIGAFLILSPTVHFWYLSLLLPFVAVRPTTSWLILCCTIGFSFVAVGYQHHTGAYFLPPWAQLAVWAIPILSMLIDLAPAVARWRRRPLWPVPETVSVVIPTLNESRRIRPCIEAMRDDASVKEIIVIDGGSTDETAAIAQACGAEVIEHRAPITGGGGRGGQILVGCRKATGDVVAVVHADTRVAPGALSDIVSTLAVNPEAPGGSVGAVFDASALKLRILEMANDFRAAFLGVSFGDQVQFFRRAPAMGRDAIPDIPLMEDVELSLRLRRLGRPVFMWGRSLVSARRWLSGSRFSSLLVIRIVAEYLLRRLWGPPDVVATYRRYYTSR